jgi:hypothetical protein
MASSCATSSGLLTIGSFSSSEAFAEAWVVSVAVSGVDEPLSLLSAKLTSLEMSRPLSGDYFVASSAGVSFP